MIAWWISVVASLLALSLAAAKTATRLEGHGGPARQGLYIVPVSWPEIPWDADPAPERPNVPLKVPVPCFWTQLAPVAPAVPFHEFEFGIRQNRDDRPWISSAVYPYRVGPEDVAISSLSRGSVNKCAYDLPDHGRLIVDELGFYYRLDGELRRADRMSLFERWGIRFSKEPWLGSAIIALPLIGGWLVLRRRRFSAWTVLGVVLVWSVLWPLGPFLKWL